MALYTFVQLFQGSQLIWCKITVYTRMYMVVTRLAVGPSPRRPGLHSRPVHVEFVLNKVALTVFPLNALVRQYHSTSAQ